MAGWYIRRGEKIVGPVELSKLQELVADGRLLPTDQLAKDVAGPWREAGSTKLFAPAPSAAIAPVAEAPPPVVVQPVEPPPANVALRVTQTALASFGRGILATWGAVTRIIATRAQRKHEIKLARIHADALREAREANRPAPPVERPQAAPPPAVFAPQLHQTTVVRVVQKNKQTKAGCGGCLTIILLIIIAFIVSAIMSSP